MIYTTITGIICGAVILWYLLTFNRLIQAKNAVDQSWSNIEVELKRRFDLIQNLVETTKGYAKHETETFRAVAELRSKEKLFADANAANQSQASLAPLIGKVMMLAESYPQLRADQNFLKLQDELTETENRIATRRNAYNQTVNRYQNLIDWIPSNIVAWIHAFAEKSFFDAPDELADAAPKVTL
jgi:LemA protein